MGIDPGTLALVSLGTTLLGTGVQAYGQYTVAKAANAQADYQAKVAANNAATAEMEAKFAEQQGERNAEAQRRKTAIMIGSQRARMGASGAVVDSGSFLDLTLDTAKQGELDAKALLNEGRMQAWRSRVQGTNLMAQSNLYKSSKTNPFLAAGGTLLEGAGRAGFGYYQMTGGGGLGGGGVKGTSSGTSIYGNSGFWR
jgi:hypothetical protein